MDATTSHPHTSIFPKMIHSIATFIITTLLIAITLVCCSCSSTKRISESVPIETVKEVNIHDTLVIHDVQYDSIYVSQDLYTDRSRDTMLIREKQVEYRYRLLRDTVERVRFELLRDSIPYEVRITETKEIQRPLTFYDRLTRSVFWFVIGILLCAIVFRLRKVFKRPNHSSSNFLSEATTSSNSL